jgi:hypothetical protein
MLLSSSRYEAGRVSAALIMIGDYR